MVPFDVVTRGGNRMFSNSGGVTNLSESFEVLFQLGNIWSRDVFRPIARKRKYLMDYRLENMQGYFSADIVCSEK